MVSVAVLVLRVGFSSTTTDTLRTVESAHFHPAEFLVADSSDRSGGKPSCSTTAVTITPAAAGGGKHEVTLWHYRVAALAVLHLRAVRVSDGEGEHGIALLGGCASRACLAGLRLGLLAVTFERLR